MAKFTCLASALLFLAVPAMAQAPGSTTAPNNTKRSDVNKIVCRTVEQLGSRLNAKKVCLTVQEWKLRADADREQAERIQQSVVGPSGN